MNRMITAMLAALLPLTAAADRDLRKTAPLSENGTVEIVNVAGEVEVRGWDRDEVELEAQLGDDVEDVEFEAERDRVRIRVQTRSGKHHDGDAEAVLRVRVPATSRVEVVSVSADVLVSGLRASQRLQTVSGDIRTELGAGEAEIQTISGDVSAEGTGAASTLTLSLVSGDATVRGIAGELDARAISGDMDIDAGMLTRVRVSNTSGDLELRGRLEPRARVDVESVSGDARLALCGERDARFELSTFSGSIDDFAGGREPQRERFGPGARLQFSEGAGSARVTVNTMSGDIELDDC